MTVLITPSGVFNRGHALLLGAAGSSPTPTPTPPPAAIPGITSSVVNPGADGYGPGIYFPPVVYGRTNAVDAYARMLGDGFARLETGGIQAWTVAGHAAFSYAGKAGTTLYQQPSISVAGDIPLTITVTDGITTKTATTIARLSAKAVPLSANVLLDTSPVNYGSKNINDPLGHFAGVENTFEGDFSGASNITLTDTAGLLQLDPHYGGGINPLIVNSEAGYPLPQHYGLVAGSTAHITYSDATTATQAAPVWIVQEQPAAIKFTHPALFDFYAAGDVWGQLTAFSDAGIVSMAVLASDVPMTINAQGRPVIAGAVVAGTGRHTTFRVTSKNGVTTDLTVTYDVGAGTVLAPSAMTMAVSSTLDNYVRNQVVGTPAVAGMTGPIAWALVQEDTFNSIYGGGLMKVFVQDLTNGQVSCTDPPPATNQATGAHRVTGKVGPIRRPNGHLVTLIATSGSVRCKQVFNVQVAWHVGPVIQVGRGMKALYGALGEDTFAAGISRFNKYYGGPSAADAGGTLLFHYDADPNYYANDGMLVSQLRQGIMGPVKMRWADPTQPRPRLGGTVGAAYMATTNQKAFILASLGDMVIEGLEVSWCHGYDSIHGQSNIRKDEDTYGDLTVIDCNLHDGDNGIEVGSGPGRFWAVRSAFSNCGDEYVGSGPTHGIYASGLLEVNVHDCLFHRIINGHNVKSRAARTNIIDSRLYDGERGAASNLVDASYGGDLLVQGCDIHKGPQQQNPYAIQHGEEGEQYGTNNPRRHSVRVLNNRVSMMLPAGNHGGGGCVVSTADARSNIDGSGSSLVMTANSIYLRPGDGGIMRNQNPYGAHSVDRQLVPQTETGTVLLGVPFALDFSDPTTGQLLSRPGPVGFIADGSDTFPNFFGVQIDVGSDDVRVPANSAIGTSLTAGGRADGTILNVFVNAASPYGAPFGPGTVWAVVQDPQWSGAVPWAPVGRYGVTTNADGTCVPKVAGALGAAGTVDYFKLRATGPGGIMCDYRVYVVLT